ncbi:MAG: Spore maturation protein B [Firmicutes bacterium ADurb.Bin182]|nr:MAG: Spore maturation protein B [Firmicutes bacterium ADurb.Bin182]
MSAFIIPVMVLALIAYALIKRVNIYDAFIEGAREGLPVVINVLPYIAAILLSLNLFRDSGALGALIDILDGPLKSIGMPAELTPLALLRPLSGGASLGILADIYANYGTESFIGLAASVMMGSSETIFYTLALYFGCVNITKTRYTLPASLLATLAGIIASLVFAHLFFTRSVIP